MLTGTHPLIGLELEVRMDFKGELAKKLVEYAERYNREPVELLSDLITKTLNEDLVDAIMDEE